MEGLDEGIERERTWTNVISLSREDEEEGMGNRHFLSIYFAAALCCFS